MYKPEKLYLDFNANKIRWLADSKILPSNVFAIGSGENSKQLTIWKLKKSAESPFDVNLIGESNFLDGEVTELKAKKTDEVFLSTTNGSIYYFKCSPGGDLMDDDASDVTSSNVEKLKEIKISPQTTIPNINSFDLNNEFDELCFVNENGEIHFLRLNSISSATSMNPASTFSLKEQCCLNSVLYVKQFEVATADSLGRVKLIDTRNRDTKRAPMTFLLEGESASIQCLANHPNQQHLIACGNSNGFVFIFDVRNQKKPFIMSHAYSEPVVEVCFHPLSTDNLLSCSFNGSLMYWNVSSKNEFSNWDDRAVNCENLLADNKYPVNSFDINGENIIAVNNNFNLIRVKYHNYM